MKFLKTLLSFIVVNIILIPCHIIFIFGIILNDSQFQAQSLWEMKHIFIILLPLIIGSYFIVKYAITKDIYGKLLIVMQMTMLLYTVLITICAYYPTMFAPGVADSIMNPYFSFFGMYFHYFWGAD